MTITPQTKHYFRFQFTEAEKRSGPGQEFIAELKKKIPHKKRYWIREAESWAIHNAYIEEFCGCLVRFVGRTVLGNQNQMGI